MPAFGEGERLLVTGSTHDEWGIRKTDDPEVHAALVERINQKILQAEDIITQIEEYRLKDATIVVVAYGFTARSARFAVRKLREKGKPVGLLRLKTLWPFPGQKIEMFSPRVEKIVVPEMNRGQVAGEVQKYTQKTVIPISQTNGEIIHPRRIMGEIERVV